MVIDWRIMFGIFFVLNILDWHSTLLIRKKYGLEAEKNKTVRAILGGGNKLFLLFKLLFVPVLALSGFYLYREYFFLQAALDFIFFVIVIHNYAQFLTNK